MDKSTIKASILQSISEELDLWLAKESTIQDGYEYETEFMNTARKVNQILLSKSLCPTSVNRNKKNSRPVLGSLK